MTPKKIPSDAAGVYLYRRSQQLTVDIDRGAVLVFWYPPEKALGVVICPDAEDHKTLDGLLETMATKLKGVASDDPSQIQVKLFGLSTPHVGEIPHVRSWLANQGFRLVSSDTEKGVSRKLLIDGQSGLVGVRYADADAPEAPPFLRLGTARTRIPAGASEADFFVLSANRVTRVLLRQTLEENPHWQPTIPEGWEKELTRKNWKKFPYQYVLICEDIEDAGWARKLATWVIRLSQSHPNAVVCWVGNRRMPSFQTGFLVHSFPALRPEFIADFKNRLNRLVEDEPSQGTGRVVPFRGKKKKRA